MPEMHTDMQRNAMHANTAPEGTTASDTQARTNKVISKLNEEHGAEYVSNNTGMSEFKVQGTSATDTTPTSASPKGEDV